MARHALRVGRVVSFDELVGEGVVRGDDGDELWFHCASIANGSRTIAVETAVRFAVEPGRRGCFEAVALDPVN